MPISGKTDNVIFNKFINNKFMSGQTDKTVPVLAYERTDKRTLYAKVEGTPLAGSQRKCGDVARLWGRRRAF